MTKKRFWEIVRKINWSRYWKFDKNCEICRQRMLKACTQDELKEFEDMASIMRSKLEERIKAYYRIISNGVHDYMCPEGFANWIGNDTMSDGLWHIVGKGKSTYEKVMKNPDEFWGVFGNVYSMIDTECFSYIFHEFEQKYYYRHLIQQTTINKDFIFDCKEVKSNLLRELGITPDGLKLFIKNGWMEFDHSDTFSDKFINNAKYDVDGVEYCKESVLEVINYAKWSEEKKDNLDFYYEVVSELVNEIRYHAEVPGCCMLIIREYVNETKETPITIITLDEDTYHMYCYEVYYYGWYNGTIDILAADSYESFEEACKEAEYHVKGCEQLREADKNDLYFECKLEKGECIAVVRNYDGDNLYFTKICRQKEDDAPEEFYEQNKLV